MTMEWLWIDWKMTNKWLTPCWHYARKLTTNWLQVVSWKSSGSHSKWHLVIWWSTDYHLTTCDYHLTTTWLLADLSFFTEGNISVTAVKVQTAANAWDFWQQMQNCDFDVNCLWVLLDCFTHLPKCARCQCKCSVLLMASAELVLLAPLCLKEKRWVALRKVFTQQILSSCQQSKMTWTIGRITVLYTICTLTIFLAPPHTCFVPSMLGTALTLWGNMNRISSNDQLTTLPNPFMTFRWMFKSILIHHSIPFICGKG